VSVISGSTNAVVATIPGIIEPFGVATNPRTNTIYVTGQSDNTVSMINGRTNTVVATIPVGLVPFGVATNPRTNTVYVANEGDGTVTALACGRG
jgi:YVTN family beta-propeller protein